MSAPPLCKCPATWVFSDRAVGLAPEFFSSLCPAGNPGALIAERHSARRWIARIMISWGILTVLMAFIHNVREF